MDGRFIRRRGISTAQAQALIDAETAGDVAAAIAAASAQLSFISSVGDTVYVNSVLIANQAYLFKFRVSKAMTVSEAAVFIGTPSGNIDFGVYQSDGTTLTKMNTSGSTAAAGTNALQIVPFTATPLVPGVDYYGAFAIDNATMQMARVAGVAAITVYKKRWLTAATAFPLPASFTIASLSGAALLPKWDIG